ncbi:MAG TPA: hypothetical protein VEC35_07945 [Noviherbaspirillum sp.]|nr:hypothetical protein [Noviherbaspirillum sp.]
MRLILAALFTMTAGLSVAHAAAQQQCETLAKPVETKIASLPDMKEGKPSAQDCARASEVIKLYTSYKSQADGMNCPFAYVGGQKIGGATERAELLDDMKQAHREKCR